MRRPRFPARLLLPLALTVPCALPAASGPADLRGFLEAHCARCHDEVERNGDLDLTPPAADPARPGPLDPRAPVHARAAAGRKPPPAKAPPPAARQAANPWPSSDTRGPGDRGQAGGGRKWQRKKKGG